MRIGGIPLDRRKTTGFIDALLAEFRSRDWMWLAIAPEGTRSHTDHLESRLLPDRARGRRPGRARLHRLRDATVGIDTYLRMTGDRDADLARIRDFYATSADGAPSSPAKSG